MTSPASVVEYVDTHCHPVLLGDSGLLDAAWESCSEHRVTQVISVGLNLEDSDRNRQMAESRSGVFFTVGWHPHETLPPDAAQVRALDELLGHPRAVAVGEIGLDLYFRPGYHETTFENQMTSINIMMELAQTHAKPVVIHSRDAHLETLTALAAWPAVKGVMHCFSGTAEFSKQCMDLGYVPSFSGIVTFGSAKDIQGAAVSVADGEYLVETDAPFLAPVPMRGKSNLPGYVAHTAAGIARLRQQPVEEVALQTTRRARSLFGLGDTDLLPT